MKEMTFVRPWKQSDANELALLCRPSRVTTFKKLPLFYQIQYRVYCTNDKYTETLFSTLLELQNCCTENVQIDISHWNDNE